MTSIMDGLEGLPGRLRRWRTVELDVSQADLLKAVNEKLPEGHQRRSPQSVSDWEQPWIDVETGKWKESPHSGIPPAFLAGLKRAYPDLNLEWLLFGVGEPRVSDQEAKEFQERMAELWELDPDPDVLIPSMWLRRHLPREAKEALLSFYREVLESDVATYQRQTGPDREDLPQKGTKEDPIPWADFVRIGDRVIDKVRKRIAELLAAPFRGGDAWVSIEDLSDAEITSYVQGQLAAWRPLIRSLRSGE